METLPADVQSRIMGLEYVDPSQLTAHSRNFRRHPVAQRRALRSSVERFGWSAPILVTTDGTVVDGHARVEEALSAGLATVPVLRLDMDEEEAAALILHLDPIAAMATTDQAALDELLASVENVSEDLFGMLASHDLLVEDTPAEADIVDTGSVISVTGDIWVLRSSQGVVHRVLCGDAVELVSALDQVDSLVTDPPYGIDYGDTVAFRRAMGKTQRPESDSHVRNDGAEEAVDLWSRLFPLIKEKLASVSSYYVWGPSGPMFIDLGLALRSAGLAPRATVVWSKSSFSFGRSDHKYQHEQCYYGWKQTGTHRFYGPSNESSVWEYDRPQRSDLHPTQKPVDLIRRCVRNSADQGGTVLDPFCGSGTSLIACELEKRACVTIEIEPKYVDIAVRRWQQLTGVMPEREDTGEIVDFIG